jgi:hypothetical protein
MTDLSQNVKMAKFAAAVLSGHSSPTLQFLWGPGDISVLDRCVQPRTFPQFVHLRHTCDSGMFFTGCRYNM